MFDVDVDRRTKYGNYTCWTILNCEWSIEHTRTNRHYNYEWIFGERGATLHVDKMPPLIDQGKQVSHSFNQSVLLHGDLSVTQSLSQSKFRLQVELFGPFGTGIANGQTNTIQTVCQECSVER